MIYHVVFATQDDNTDCLDVECNYLEQSELCEVVADGVKIKTTGAIVEIDCEYNPHDEPTVTIGCPECGVVEVVGDIFESGEATSGICPKCKMRLYFAPNDQGENDGIHGTEALAGK